MYEYGMIDGDGRFPLGTTDTASNAASACAFVEYEVTGKVLEWHMVDGEHRAEVDAGDAFYIRLMEE